MNKINLIINREYLTRVKNKKFILTTLLTPLGFLLFFVVVGVIFSYESKKITALLYQIKVPLNYLFPLILSDLNLVPPMNLLIH